MPKLSRKTKIMRKKNEWQGISRTFSEFSNYHSDDGESCINYGPNGVIKVYNFDCPVKDVYRKYNCIIMGKFVDNVTSLSRTQYRRYLTLVTSYVKKFHLQPHIDKVQSVCPYLYHILYYDIWLRKSNNVEHYQKHKKLVSDLLVEMKHLICSSQVMNKYFRFINFSFNTSQKVPEH